PIQEFSINRTGSGMSDAVSSSDAASSNGTAPAKDAAAAKDTVAAVGTVAAAAPAADENIERLTYDVVVVGAGGSGLRAAIEARLQGKKTAIISKSLFGKAHTVMAEGGCAASVCNG